MSVIDLFCGTKSLEHVCNANNLQYITVDLNVDRNASYTCDILNWDYSSLLNTHPLLIWASPPCTEYSQFNRAIPNKIPNIAQANSYVLKVLEIINALKPKYWIIENPQTGLLKHQPFMKNIPFVDVTYCKYGKSYRKATRLWTNVPWIPFDMCSKVSPCPKYRRHSSVAATSYDERIAVPPAIIDSLFSCILPL